LPGGGPEQVGAAHDFGDEHGGIIHDDRKLVGGAAVVAPDDKISEIAARDELLRPELAIDKADGFAIRNTKAPICDFGFWILDWDIVEAAADGSGRQVPG
jgi:hypothetical protein